MWKLTVAEESAVGQNGLVSLNNFQGRQVWKFDPNAGTPEEKQKIELARKQFAENRLVQKNSSDELLRIQQIGNNLDSVEIPQDILDVKLGDKLDAERVEKHIRGALNFYSQMQSPDGHWGGDYGGPMFLMPGLIITCYTTGVIDEVFSPEHKKEMIRYLWNHQNADGGFGLHIEGHSTMFGTALSYVSLRLLGESADSECMQLARSWIFGRGGAHYITSWGKFWLAVLGVYEWEGLNPLNPEMWLLPYSAWTGIGYLHPGRFWCHCRQVYLPMSYIYGCRGTCKKTELVELLRNELYPTAYDHINWDEARNLCAQEDLYYPHPFIQDVLWWMLSKVEPYLLGSSVRKLALDECMKHIHYEDENTRYICIGPVNKALNMLCCWLEDPKGEAFKKHLPRIYDFLWLAEDGMKMQGYNGSQSWDTTFAVQAITATGLGYDYIECMKLAYEYVKQSQVVEDCPGDLRSYYRHISKGAWPFSSRDHGWPIADCSSEGLKAALCLATFPEDMVGVHIPQQNLYDCVNVILSYQNRDGGMATYENNRSFRWLEILNPSETFGDIIVDFSYVELTSACVQALVVFSKKYPEHRTEEIQNCLQKATRFVKSIQRKDGSWYGSWGVCFTYGTWFGLETLAHMGENYQNSKEAKKACDFLLQKQLFPGDGGWGETYLSCQDKVYSCSEESQVVNTAWAMLALMCAGYHKHDPVPLHAAAAYLLKMQYANGDFPQQKISGVFNRNCMITYANYRNIFPIWALGQYRRLVLLQESEE